jgi:hypothetical protein
MPELIREIEGAGIVSNDPAKVIGATRADQTVAWLMGWNRATGDVSHNAPAGTDAGGGSRIHYFDGHIIANKAAGARVSVGTAGANGSAGVPLEPGLEIRGYLDKVQARITGLEQHANFTTGGIRFAARTNLDAVSDLGVWDYLGLDVRSAAGFCIGALAGRRRITGGASAFGFIGDDNGWADIELRDAYINGNALATAFHWRTGGAPFATRTAVHGYTMLYDGSGAGAILIGGTGDQRTYHNNNAHYFRTFGGAQVLAWIDTPDAGYGSLVLYFGDGGGLVAKRVRMDAAAGGKRALYVDA